MICQPTKRHLATATEVVIVSEYFSVAFSESNLINLKLLINNLFIFLGCIY